MDYNFPEGTCLMFTKKSQSNLFGFIVFKFKFNEDYF